MNLRGIPSQYRHLVMQGLQEMVQEMTSPVRCAHCGSPYDLGTVTITQRYTDATFWKAPCCGRTVDDRPTSIFGKSSPQDYERISKSEPIDSRLRFDVYGNEEWGW